MPGLWSGGLGQSLNEMLIQPLRQGGRIDPTSPAAPTRIIIRAACDFLLAISVEGARTFGSIPRAVILTAIAVANVQHIMRSAVRTWRYAGLDQIPPDSERRPVSILGLSQSLQKPFETTRAHVNALIDDGLCIKTAGGVIVPSEVLLTPKVAALDAAVWETFWKMISDLRSLDYDFSTVVGEAAKSSTLVVEEDFHLPSPTQPPRRLVSRVISELYLSATVEANAPHGDDWVTGQVYIGFVTLNSAGWSLKAEHAWRYSRVDTPPPDHIRTPASIADVARHTGLGKELVRRKAHELVDAGRLDRTPGGFLVSMDYIQGPQNRAGGAALVAAFYRMIYDLNALGVQP